MAISILTDHAQAIDQPTRNTHQKTRIRDCVLESCRFLPSGKDAICRVRDLNTGALRQALASKLLAINWGKDAYLLEILARGGN